jgi:hypothetical protein
MDDGVKTHRPRVKTANYNKPECAMAKDRLEAGPANIPEVIKEGVDNGTEYVD